MTPQEISDYKREWMPGYTAQVDMDSHEIAKTWCRRNLERHQWSFKKHTMPDDSHTVFFENEDDKKSFVEYYNTINSKFDTESYQW